MKFRLMTSALAASLLIAACGGGGGGDKPASGSGAAILSGTAAAGLALVGSVTVKDANGVTRTVSIGSNGAYTVDVSGLTAPFLLRASGTAGGSTYVVHSAATSADVNGNINITPLTDLILSNVAGQIASNYFDSGSFSGLSATQLSTEAAKLKEKLLPVLQAMGVDAATDLLRTAFTPQQDALDKALDAISVSYDTSTNIATLTNVLTSESITDSITTSAAQETSPPTMSDTTNLNAASDDIPLIRAALASFSAEFKNGLPTETAIKSHLSGGFALADSDRNAFASELAGDSNNVGLQFTDVTVHSIDYTTDSSSPVADVSLLVKNGTGVVINQLQHFKIRRISGTWKLHGDQRVLDASANVHITRTVYQQGSNASVSCAGTGLEFWIEDLDSDNSAAISYIVVTGPGLPEDGVRYARPDGGGPWLIDGSVGSGDTWYQLANSCQGVNTAGLTDTQIAAIPNNATYTMTMYSSNDVVLTWYGKNGTYRNSVGARPMTLAELANSSALPAITSPATFAAFVSDDSLSPTVSASNINPAYIAWIYAAQTYSGGTVSADADLIPSSNGTISRSFSLSTPSGGFQRKEIRVETHDAGLRDIMTNYIYMAPVNSTD
ncbi:MAG TPA: hypothetical protein H9903_09215 [Candidatus Aquabacterium excrementipullorum]|nr:hypothetical protein [Candidatus Aquabacterium excrementipullorum]